MAEVALAAELRQNKGSSDSRRLRTSGRIPGVLYGHGIDPTPLSIEARALRLALNTEAGLNALIQLEVDGKKHLALSRSIQKHPVRNTVAHIDFQVVRRDEVMAVDVPILFTGEADGVTKKGGIVEHLLTSLHVSAKPTDIPPNIEVDITNLQLDESIRIKDIALPAGVTSLADPEDPIVVGKPSRVTAADEADAAAVEAAAGDGTPAADGAAAAPEATPES